MYSTRPTLPTDKQAHVKRDELTNPMCRRNIRTYSFPGGLSYTSSFGTLLKLGMTEKLRSQAIKTRVFKVYFCSWSKPCLNPSATEHPPQNRECGPIKQAPRVDILDGASDVIG